MPFETLLPSDISRTDDGEVFEFPPVRLAEIEAFVDDMQIGLYRSWASL